MSKLKDVAKSKNLLLVDVRSNEEYRADHISEAINIPLDEIDSPKHIYHLQNSQRPIVLCCRSGNRSQTAFSKLSGMGLEVYDGGSCVEFYRRNML
ncbi:MAG: rhodanese-like domain-containing protein [Thermonemataceae bacterium]|nr:rhodanese-like domain-containing protein [Thermonemataceae bacterium]